jgi:DNA-binding NarL/FixJ family response regulator
MKQNNVRLLIADDAPVIRKAIKGLLAQESSIEILGEAENFNQAMSMASTLKPDVILLDLHMTDNAAYEPGIVKNQFFVCRSRVVAMSLAQDEETKNLAEEFGAVAILDKANLYDVLIPTIWKAAHSDKQVMLIGRHD